MDPAKPSLELLRSLTDEHVLRALMRRRRLTRAELAAETGISKPTVGESVRRLTETGSVVDTGQRTPGGRGRGRVGSYYALAEDTGVALAVSIAPEGVVAECVDAYGDPVSRAEQAISRPARPDDVASALRTAAADARRHAGRTPRLAVVSAADPVNRHTGKLVQLPDAPFLLGELDPVEALAAHVDGPVTVDNDVNWAARAERDNAGTALDDFAYLFLSEGLGCAIISDGKVMGGHAGLAGEIAHLVTAGPRGQATPLIEVFGELGLRRPGSTAIDVERLLATVGGAGTRATTDATSPRSSRQRSSRRRCRARRPATHRHRRLVGQPPRRPRRHLVGRRTAPPTRPRPSRRPDDRTSAGRRPARSARPTPLGHHHRRLTGRRPTGARRGRT